jgi:hypothetical protein
MQINDTLSKGQPAGFVHSDIVSHVLPRHPTARTEKQMAFEAGFAGEHQVDSWRKQTKHMQRLGFIDYQGGTDHDYKWVPSTIHIT